jgi:hypothetical protein
VQTPPTQQPPPAVQSQPPSLAPQLPPPPPSLTSSLQPPPPAPLNLPSRRQLAAVADGSTADGLPSRSHLPPESTAMDVDAPARAEQAGARPELGLSSHVRIAKQMGCFLLCIGLIACVLTWARDRLSKTAPEHHAAAPLREADADEDVRGGGHLVVAAGLDGALGRKACSDDDNNC